MGNDPAYQLYANGQPLRMYFGMRSEAKSSAKEQAVVLKRRVEVRYIENSEAPEDSILDTFDWINGTVVELAKPE